MNVKTTSSTNSKRVFHRSAWVCAAFLCAPVVFAKSNAAADKQPDTKVAVCGSPANIVKTDFRDRSTPQRRFNIDDNKLYHLDPANNRMAQGEYSRNVMADIAWTLDRYPNHQVALGMLVKYELAGGKLYEYPLPECYFQWARKFAPDDPQVMMAQGYYYWRKKNYDRAREVYQEALTLNPDSADAHYNIGLVYFDMKNYDQAADHAQAAYKLGFQLPGLRNKLAAAGHPLPAVTPTPQ